jgi:hypothetical protein
MNSIRAQEIHQQIIQDQKQYLDLSEQEWEGLMEARLAFRNLLQDHSLLVLIGDESESVEFLERQVLEVVYSITKRQRLQTLLRQGKEMLRREQQGNLPDGERDQKPRPSTGRRFRRFNLANTGNSVI